MSHHSVADDNDEIKSKVQQKQTGWFSWATNWKWKPTSNEQLKTCENQLFSYVKCKMSKMFVEIKQGVKIWTVVSNEATEDKTLEPLVLVHGFGGGVGLWVLNYEALASKRKVYAFDLLGFGQSSRPKFSTDPDGAEKEFVVSIEEWRRKMGIDKMVLLGHSFGGYLSACYALEHPQNVKNLILADPWGFPERDPEKQRKLPIWVKGLVTLLRPFNPLALVRASGPWGPSLVKKVRSDFNERFKVLDEENEVPILDYIYHCNADYPSGETAFKLLSDNLGYAHRPMLKRIHALDASVPVNFIYGARSWMDHASGRVAQSILQKNQVEVYSVKGAGHHVYADRPELFHQIIDSILDNSPAKESD